MTPSSLASSPASISSRLSDYLELSKPRISLTVVLSALAGYLLASGHQIPNPSQLSNLLLGTLLVSAGASMLNMLSEMELDALMQRTRNRPLPCARVSPAEALLLGTFLAGFGVVHLALAVNLSSALLAALGLTLYLVLYTPLKLMTPISTLIGAVSGALPPLIGWSAAQSPLQAEAWILFGILLSWQFPHILALAWLYREDYRTAGIQILPPEDQKAKKILARVVPPSCLLLSLGSLLPAWTGLSGLFYLAIASAAGLFLIVLGIAFAKSPSAESAKRFFLTTVLYLPVLLLSIVLGL